MFPRPAVANDEDAKQVEAIFNAAASGNLDTLKQLIGNGTADVKMADGATPLFDAAMQGQTNVLRWLLDKGANVNSAMSNGTTALHLAVSHGQEAACRILLDKGANVNAAIRNGYDDERRLNDKFLLTPLSLAMNRKAKDIILLLIDRGADVNAPLGRGYVPDFPLEVAAWPEPDDWPGQKDVIKALVAKGAKSPWLSRIKEFDPYNLNALTPEKNEKGDIMVGSMELVMGAQAVKRPWTLPPESTRSKHGKNFWRWASPTKDEGPLPTTWITDEKGQMTQLQIVPAIYIGDSGIAYSENISAIDKGGPFVDIIVDGSDNTKRVTAVRGDGKTIEIAGNGNSFRATLGGVTDYEPISLTKYANGDVKQSTIEFDCVYRAAKSGAVIYHIR